MAPTLTVGPQKPPSKRQAFPTAVTIVAGAITLTSCNFGTPAVYQPSIDASQAASLAMQQYDTNRDGNVAGAELHQAPGLKAALPRLDTNQDGGVNADEIADRVNKWKEMRTAVSLFAFTVTLDDRPIPDAKVVFEPEQFLGAEIKVAGCMTNDFGRCGATIPDDERDDAEAPPGMHFGLYKVKISRMVSGKETIPARYNEHTVLGQEVAADVPEIINNRVVYALSTR